MRDMIRHHLERTTGGSGMINHINHPKTSFIYFPFREELDGLILSPTREKLEPTIPRKDDDSRGSQKNSPKKNSPLKSSSLKRQNQKPKVGPKNCKYMEVVWYFRSRYWFYFCSKVPICWSYDRGM